jgi:hypothetical protein
LIHNIKEKTRITTKRNKKWSYHKKN